ncbi:MAG: flagellar basal body rod C-terminal domain-containing protein [Candidatus Gastranaerophilales bacterium]|nr:flagellar basal body rod C-terminal domain-containing protein [Candidatus Gastranaerophilales bacterium]
MGLLDAINVGSSGLFAHGKRLEIHARNIANTDTPNYQRKIPVLMATEDISFHGVLTNMKDNVFASGTLPHKTGGVNFTGIIVDSTPGDLVYSPGHPDADRNGYIRRSNVNPMIDIADATMTSRAYEASLALVGVTKAMAQRAAEIGK